MKLHQHSLKPAQKGLAMGCLHDGKTPMQEMRGEVGGGVCTKGAYMVVHYSAQHI